MSARISRPFAAGLLGFALTWLGIHYHVAHATESIPTSGACPQQLCVESSFVDMEGVLRHYWRCETPGVKTDKRCSWRLGDCYMVDCRKSGPGHNLGTPNEYIP